MRQQPCHLSKFASEVGGGLTHSLSCSRDAGVANITDTHDSQDVGVPVAGLRSEVVEDTGATECNSAALDNLAVLATWENGSSRVE